MLNSAIINDNKEFTRINGSNAIKDSRTEIRKLLSRNLRSSNILGGLWSTTIYLSIVDQPLSA
ncbi:hypothetical protein GCM10007922_38220 [Shewanella decolorationis]|nr:hypothetical protein GCM10007922_38220 [Shewanella decolorationis]